MQQNHDIKKGFTLTRNERLKSRKLMEQLFREGFTFFIHPFKVYHQVTALPAGTGMQAAFGVSSRVFKKAVDRNRIKRLMREAYRLQKTGLQQQLLAGGKNLAVFFLYTGREMPDQQLVKEKMAVMLEKLGKSMQIMV